MGHRPTGCLESMAPPVGLPTPNRPRGAIGTRGGRADVWSRAVSPTRARALPIAIAAALVLAACGGAERQDADEKKGSYRVEVVSASFPAQQRIAGRSTMRVTVRNADSKTLPNVALTVKTGARRPGAAPASFGQSTGDERLADDERPVWIVDSGPEGGTTAYTNTWALGKLRPNQTKTFEWRVTAVEPGRYTITYEAAPGLDGRAKLASGSDASGRFRVVIDDSPVDASVDANGEVVRGE